MSAAARRRVTLRLEPAVVGRDGPPVWAVSVAVPLVDPGGKGGRPSWPLPSSHASRALCHSAVYSGLVSNWRSRLVPWGAMLACGTAGPTRASPYSPPWSPPVHLRRRGRRPTPRVLPRLGPGISTGGARQGRACHPGSSPHPPNNPLQLHHHRVSPAGAGSTTTTLSFTLGHPEPGANGGVAWHDSQAARSPAVRATDRPQAKTGPSGPSTTRSGDGRMKPSKHETEKATGSVAAPPPGLTPHFRLCPVPSLRWPSFTCTVAGP